MNFRRRKSSNLWVHEPRPVGKLPPVSGIPRVSGTDTCPVTWQPPFAPPPPSRYFTSPFPFLPSHPRLPNQFIKHPGARRRESPHRSHGLTSRLSLSPLTSPPLAAPHHHQINSSPPIRANSPESTRGHRSRYVRSLDPSLPSPSSCAMRGPVVPPVSPHEPPPTVPRSSAVRRL